MTEAQAVEMLDQLQAINEQVQYSTMAIFVFIGVVLACTIAVIIAEVLKR